MERGSIPSTPNRREFVGTAAVLAATAIAGSRSSFAAEVAAVPAAQANSPRFQFSVKSGMIQDPACKSWEDKFRMLKEIGYDGVEYDQGLDANPHEIAAASAKVDFPVQGLVNPYHWDTRLSDADPAIREKAIANMETAIRFAKAVGASTVLLVPGKVTDSQRENFDQVWQRSIAGIRRIIPLAARLGIRIGIENVWNQFLYQHDGPSNQSADLYNKYVDEIASTWVGIYFDFSNHRKYGNPAAWMRSMGSRIIKCDTKDFRIGKNEFCDVGEGDVPWDEVRQACAATNYYGWVSSEVGGGDRQRLTKVLADLKKVLY